MLWCSRPLDSDRAAAAADTLVFTGRRVSDTHGDEDEGQTHWKGEIEASRLLH